MLKAGLKRTDVECNWKRRNSTEIWLASKRSRAEIIRAVCRFRNKSSETGLDFKLIGAHILFSYLFWNSLCIKISLCAALRLRHKSWLRQNACLFVSATAHKSLASRCLSMRVCVRVPVCVRVLACTYMHCSNRPCWPHSPHSMPRHEQCVFLPHFIFLKLNRFINLANCV